MSGLWERKAALEVIARLEKGEAPANVASSLGLDALDLVAAVAHDAIGESAGGDWPPLVQGSPKRPGLKPTLLEDGIPALFPSASRPARLALAAGLLQIHDFWDASHNAAQLADDLGESTVSAYWHGIGHRREPDAGNASYWFRRVGRHHVFGALADSVRSLRDLSEPEAKAVERLLPRGAWDPFAFIDLCCSSTRTNSRLALTIQRIEMRLLLDASIPA